MCLKCDEKINPGYRCKNRLYQTIILQESEETKQESDEEGEAQAKETSKTEEAPIELSVNSIVGITRKNTMKVKGKLGGERDMIILIDSGASEYLFHLILFNT